jgi:hypothetical protein
VIGQNPPPVTPTQPSLICGRRPLLVTGRSSLAYLIARELDLGPVLRWPITP